MTDDRMFTELPQDEQQMLIDEVKRLKLTCEPKKMKAEKPNSSLINGFGKIENRGLSPSALKQYPAYNGSIIN